MAGRGYWVWSTHPLEDRIDALNEGRGWWTCHRDTVRGDLVLVYLTSPDRHIAYLVEAASNAELIVSDPGNPGEWDGGYACNFLTHAKFPMPLDIGEMKSDRLLRDDFKALRGNFQQRVYEVPPIVWSHLVKMLVASNKTTSRSVRNAERHAVAEEVLLEVDIENALEENLDVLKPKWNLKLDKRQFACGGLGFIDLLCHDRRGPVVIEFKRGRAKADVVAQTAAYMGWIRENRTGKGKRVRGLVISDDYDRRFQLAATSVPDLHHVQLNSIANSLGL